MKRKYIIHYMCDFDVYGEDYDEAYDNAYEMIQDMPSRNPLLNGEIVGIEEDTETVKYFS